MTFKDRSLIPASLSMHAMFLSLCRAALQSRFPQIRILGPSFAEKAMGFANVSLLLVETKPFT
jgi:hypothetical protein